MGNNCGGIGHPAKLCRTLPDHATQAVDEEGDTDKESEEGDVCGSSGNVDSTVQATKTLTSWDAYNQ